MNAASASPISRPVDVGRLPPGGLEVRIEAGEEQRRALAEIHGLEAVARLEAALVVRRWGRDGAHVEGVVDADIVQRCVVTLEPVEEHIEERVSATFLPEDPMPRRAPGEPGGEHVLDPEEADPPETFSGGHIDVGQIAEEFFSLAIDPYPRKAGAELAPQQSSRDGQEGPFGSLGRLRREK